MRVPLNWLRDYIDIGLPAQEVAAKLTMIGHALDKPIYQVEGDTVMDLEDRGNRADTMGIIGIARELAALTKTNIRYPRESVIPRVGNEKMRPKISVYSDKVIRWTAVLFRNVKIGPSPQWIRQRLKSYGMEVINNVVDITNFVMVETGMPLHAFDADRLDEIILRNAKRGEGLITFEGTRLTLDEEDLVAADDQKPLTLTTAVGGKETGVSDSTTNILIEAGLYHQPTARRSAIKHNVRNETSSRLEKYLHPHYCLIAVRRAVKLMEEIVGARAEGVSYDYYPNVYKPAVVDLGRKRLNLIAGSAFDLDEVAGILKRLEFTIKQAGDLNLTVEVPYFRTDIAMEDDLVEEVLRIKGYDSIPSYLPLRSSPPKLVFPEMDLENRIRDILVNLGFNEVVGSQIVDINESRKTEALNENKIVELQNSWNRELNILRPEFISSQLKYIGSYIKHDITPIKIFEIGKSYSKEEGSGYEKYKEIRETVLSLDADFHTLKSNLLRLLSGLGIRTVSFEKTDFPAFKKETAARVIVNSTDVGKIGELRKSVRDAFGIGRQISHAVLYVSPLMEKARPEAFPKVSTSVPHYISEDFTFTVNEKDEIGKLAERISKATNPDDVLTFMGMYADERLKSKGRKSVTFNIKFATDNSVNAKTRSDRVKSLQIKLK